MGAEARALGHGGIDGGAGRRARAVTVSRGVGELEAGGEPLGRVAVPAAAASR